MRLRRKIWGGQFYVVWGGEWGDKKLRKENDRGLRQPPNDKFDTTTNQNKQAQRRGAIIGRETWRGREGGSIESISGWSSSEEDKKRNKIEWTFSCSLFASCQVVDTSSLDRDPGDTILPFLLQLWSIRHQFQNFFVSSSNSLVLPSDSFVLPSAYIQHYTWIHLMFSSNNCSSFPFKAEKIMSLWWNFC